MSGRPLGIDVAGAEDNPTHGAVGQEDVEAGGSPGLGKLDPGLGQRSARVRGRRRSRPWGKKNRDNKLHAMKKIAIKNRDNTNRAFRKTTFEWLQ